MIYPLFLEMRQSQLTALTRSPKLGSEPWNFFQCRAFPSQIRLNGARTKKVAVSE
jgi:hypothetical protein